MWVISEYIRFFALILLSAAAVSDLRQRRISNLIIIMALFSGALFQLILYGFTGLFDSLGRMIIVIAVLFVFFCFGGFGAGDVKLYGMLSLFVTFEEFLQIFSLSIYFGAGYFVAKRNKSIPMAFCTLLAVLTLMIIKIWRTI